jgi:RNA polymerase sigma-70 factor (ECF subfamily)
VDSPVNITVLVEQYYSDVYRFAVRLAHDAHQAEDMTQQAFLQAHRKLDTLRDIDRAKPWLFTIVRNVFRQEMRRGTVNTVELDAVNEPGQVESHPLDHDNLRSAIKSISNEFSDVLILFYFEELSYKEIAETLEIPVGTVMSRLARGKRHLRELLSIDYE